MNESARISGREAMQVFAHTWLKNFVPASSGASIIALRGDLGAGKTTFVQGVAAALGVDAITSPTFVIQKSYAITQTNIQTSFQKLVHIDAYRLESTQELLQLGFAELANEMSTLIFIEWPERVPGITPTETLLFTWISENERLVERQ